MLYNQFSIIDISSNYSTNSFLINTNFSVDPDTINKDNIKISIIKDEKQIAIDTFMLVPEGKNIIVKFDDYAYADQQFFIYINNLKDKLGRVQHVPYDKFIKFTPNIPTQLNITTPLDQFASKTKAIHIEVAILGDGNNTIQVGDASDIAIFNEDGSFADNIKMHLEIGTDKSFLNSEYIHIYDNRSESSNSYEVSVSNIDRLKNTMAFDLQVKKDTQYYIRARMERADTIFGEWSNTVTFMVKTESLLDPSDDYMHSMLFSESLFADEYEPLEVLSSTDVGFTGDEFYLEFNKDIVVPEEAKTKVTNDGLVCIGKCILIRRDL
jgi:hypothetical protein